MRLAYGIDRNGTGACAAGQALRYPAAQVRWREALIASELNLAITLIQLVYFNDPTVLVR